MFKVGVTGGMGSGKSVVCRIFRNLDIPVYEADSKARRLIEEDAGIRRELIRAFGNEVYEGGGLNRRYLADRIFSDSSARDLVNKRVHPMVREDFRSWISEQRGNYVIEEAALLFESGAYKELDYNILVSAREEIRVERVMKRDGIKRAAVLLRLASQMDPDEAAKMADLIIYNDENELLIPQVLAADKLIRERLTGNSDME